ncbi:DUF2254 family protein [Parerythrobacter aurantius]|uniref:DUF2254 family protein n=1 Tax=Parerythrobacter aurantius TaxID=3127706 RepID=UPI003255BE5F
MPDVLRAIVPHWLVHRLVANYWMLAVCATLAALPLAYGVLLVDRNGATAWLLAQGMAPVATADTAKDFVGVAAGVNAAFIALYFSITLIVLSLAAGNLGVRLIDRWLKRRLVRVSLAGLSFSQIVTLVAALAIDGEAPLAETPLLLVATVMLLQAVNVAMLAVSLHALGRTMFVDDSIDRVADDACACTLALTSVAQVPAALPHILRSRREGYVEEVDHAALVAAFADGAARVVVHAAPGQHVMAGEALLSADVPFDAAALRPSLPIGGYRSDHQGTVFHIRLLVEIAARALSPAINDFYTAITCADKLAAIMESHADRWVRVGHAPALASRPWLILEGQDFRSLFDDPLSALRQAASAYPSVTIRLIDNLGRLTHRLEKQAEPELLQFLRTEAAQLRDHAMTLAQIDGDRADIATAYARSFERA